MKFNLNDIVYTIGCDNQQLVIAKRIITTIDKNGYLETYRDNQNGLIVSGYSTYDEALTKAKEMIDNYKGNYIINKEIGFINFVDKVEDLSTDARDYFLEKIEKEKVDEPKEFSGGLFDFI